MARLKTNLLWLAAGNLAFGLSQWLTIVFLARALGTESVALYAVAAAPVALVMGITNLKLRSVLATDPTLEYPFATYLALRLLATAAGIAALIAWSTVADFGPPTVLALIAATMSVDAVAELFYGAVQRREAMRRIAVGRVLRGWCQLLLFGATLLVTDSLSGALGVRFVGGVVVVLAYDARSVVQFGKITKPFGAWWSKEGIQGLLRLTAPLAPALALSAAWLSLPVLVLSRSWEDREIAVFAASVALVGAGSPIMNAVSQAIAPRLATLHSNCDFAEFDLLIRRSIAIGVTIGFAGIAAAMGLGETILTGVYGEDFRGGEPVLVVVSIAIGLRFAYVFLGSGIQAMRDFRPFALIQLVAVAVLIVLLALLVPDAGGLGAASAMVGSNLAEGTMYLLFFLLVRKRTRSHAVASTS